jgi:LuxR family quorum-sensing transcriptional regulator LasR
MNENMWNMLSSPCPAPMRIAQILSISSRTSEVELTEAVWDITRLLGFDYFQYTGDFLLDRRTSIRKTFSNFPDKWLRRYAACEYGKVDPAIRHATTHVGPVIWSNFADDEALSVEEIRYLADARDHEIGEGVSYPVQMKNGDSGILSFANHIDRPATEQVVARALAEGSLTAPLVHDAMRRIVDTERKVLQAPLTQRELECLRWIAFGKSNWEIAAIFGISEHGAVYYVRKLLWKLGATNRHQAVERATVYGLL